MDDKEKYEQAKARMVEWVNRSELIVNPKEVLEYVFPELKESEDERIRKYIINHFQGHLDTCKRFTSDGMFPPFSAAEIEMLEASIAWIEKQGEHANPDTTLNVHDKVETKFKAGNWYLCVKDFLGEVIRFVKGNAYYCKIDGRLQEFDGGAHIAIVEELYEYFRLWTIQDAKDGDVIFINDGHGSDSIELIKSIYDKRIYFWFCLSSENNFKDYQYEVYNDNLPYTNFASRESATLATKEQRDLLFAKMQEAGYEWDAEKKELRKIEQKPIGWSEEDEKFFKTALWHISYSVSNGKRIDEHCATTDWLKGVKERLESLRPQNTWKPSEIQMKALLSKLPVVRNSGDKVQDILETLYDDLKKLREE